MSNNKSKKVISIRDILNKLPDLANEQSKYRALATVAEQEDFMDALDAKVVKVLVELNEATRLLTEKPDLYVKKEESIHWQKHSYLFYLCLSNNLKHAATHLLTKTTLVESTVRDHEHEKEQNPAAGTRNIVEGIFAGFPAEYRAHYKDIYLNEKREALIKIEKEKRTGIKPLTSSDLDVDINKG